MLSEIRREDGQEKLKQFLQDFQNLNTQEAVGGGGAFSGALVYRTIGVTITTATETPIPFDNELYDVGGYHDNSVNNTRLTVPADGYYRVTGHLGYLAATTGLRDMYLKVNATNYIALARLNPISGTSPTYLQAAADWFFSVGDYVELVALHTRGSNLNINPNNYYGCTLSIARMGV